MNRLLLILSVCAHCAGEAAAYQRSAAFVGAPSAGVASAARAAARHRSDLQRRAAEPLAVGLWRRRTRRAGALAAAEIADLPDASVLDAVSGSDAAVVVDGVKASAVDDAISLLTTASTALFVVIIVGALYLTIKEFLLKREIEKTPDFGPKGGPGAPAPQQGGKPPSGEAIEGGNRYARRSARKNK